MSKNLKRKVVEFIARMHYCYHYQLFGCGFMEMEELKSPLLCSSSNFVHFKLPFVISFLISIKYTSSTLNCSYECNF